MQYLTLPRNFYDYDFKRLIKKERNANLRIKYLALAYIAEGKTIAETAHLLKKSTRIIYHWLKLIREYGLIGLRDKKDGRGPKTGLSAIHYQELTQIILALSQMRPCIKYAEIAYILYSQFNIKHTSKTVKKVVATLRIVGLRQYQDGIKIIKLNSTVIVGNGKL